MTFYDTIIIGAGISGSIAAKILSNNGWKTLVIEKSKKIGGEHSINVQDIDNHFFPWYKEDITPYIKRLNIKTVGKFYSTRWFIPNGDSCLIKSKAPMGYHVYRGPISDSINVQMINDAIEKKCELSLNNELKSFIFKNKKINEVVTKKGRFQGRIIIGSDGLNSQTAKLLKFDEPKRNIKLASFGYEISNVKNIDFDIPEVFLSRSYAPGGYFYLLPYKENLATAAITISSNLTSISNIEKYYEKFIRNKSLYEKLKYSKRKTKFFGTGWLTGPRKNTVKYNAILVGDAARVMDPCLGFGLRGSITTGVLAGDFISKILKNENINEKPLYEYEKEWKDRLLNGFKMQLLLRVILNEIHDDELDIIVKQFSLLRELENKGIKFGKPYKDLTILLKETLKKYRKEKKTMKILKFMLRLSPHILNEYFYILLNYWSYNN